MTHNPIGPLIEMVWAGATVKAGYFSVQEVKNEVVVFVPQPHEARAVEDAVERLNVEHAIRRMIVFLEVWFLGEASSFPIHARMATVLSSLAAIY